MDETAGNTPAREPLAAEYARVVAAFDVLMADGAGLDVLLRGAAVLSGVVAGAERRGTTVRVGRDGQRVRDGEAVARAPSRDAGDGVVWLERTGHPAPTDAMIVERLAVAVGLLDTRYSLSNPLAVAIDAAESSNVRAAALIRLGIDPRSRARVVATAAGSAAARRGTTVVPTRYGMLRATLDTGREAADLSVGGIGRWMRADQAPQSWDEAVIAYRLTTPQTPVIDATDFGAMLALVRNFDPDAPHPDVIALSRLDARSADILRVLVESLSVRAAATELQIHHSTLQAKHEQLVRALGYDPRTVPGRMRYIAAEALRRLLPTSPDPFDEHPILSADERPHPKETHP